VRLKTKRKSEDDEAKCGQLTPFETPTARNTDAVRVTRDYIIGLPSVQQRAWLFVTRRLLQRTIFETEGNKRRAVGGEGGGVT
jgi:hypothetical protein